MKGSTTISVVTFARDPHAFARLASELDGRLGAVIFRGPTRDRVCFLVVPDSHGELWCVAEGDWFSLTRWCVLSHVRWHASLGDLVASFRSGRCVGFAGEAAFFCAVPVSVRRSFHEASA